MRPSDTKSTKVAVVIPCHNEAASIGHVIAKFPLDELARHGVQLEILVVDNGSSDNTAEIAREAGATVIHESKKGKGNALRAGFRTVSPDSEYVVMLDGDDTYSPGEILRVIEPLRSDFCDVVVGSRLGGRIQSTAMSRFNRFGNRVFTTAVRVLYGANVTDVLTGYFAWKKVALDALEPHVKSTDFAIEMEMITKMARLRHRMASVPISYHPRAGASHLHPLRDGSRILLMFMRNLAWRPPAVPEGRKIVFVSDAIYPYMKGGKEKRLHEITKRLALMGYDVHIYTMHWWNEPAKTRMEFGVHLHALSKYYEMYHGDRRTIREGIGFGLACFKLFRVQFDVLDVDHMPFFPIFTAWIVCTLRGRNLSATWHEALTYQEWVNYMGMGGFVAAGVERLSIRLPHHITAASAHTKELLETIHGRSRRVNLVASGIDASLLRAVRTSPIRVDALYVGRLVKDKNVDELIAAVDIIRQHHPEVSCLIIGDGLEKPRLKQEVTKRKLEKNITFLDSLPEASEVYGYMKAARVFCSPSTREGFGITSLEALGCGTPVVTIDSPGNAARHFIQEGLNGSKVVLSPRALSEAILYWISFASKPIISMPVAEYDWNQLAKKQVEAYML
ncbi:MAG TPA: glycosyltransferase [Candidatus Saccharimonadia bacterium]|nr:glycosyltransferase [Candidatus Saccharimonadia bacterium]